MKHNSLAYRISWTFFFNLLRGGLVLLTTLVLARYLGPETYGLMAFLVSIFLAMKTLVEFSTPHAFYTFISQKRQSKYFFKLYILWLSFQLFVLIVLITFVVPSSFWLSNLDGASHDIVVLALIAVFIQHSAWQAASQMAEASRRSVDVQKLGIAINLVNLVLIISLYKLSLLNLKIIFMLMILEWGVGTLLAARMYVAVKEADDEPVLIVRKFWQYCKPLIPVSIIITGAEALDRFMLQIWGGSAEQGYYALATTIMVTTNLVLASILKIFWKEISEAYQKKNLNFVLSIYERTSFLAYFISAVLVSAFLPWCEEILYIMGGSEYMHGKTTLALMLIFSAHQGLGQINGMLLLATEKTKLHAVIIVLAAFIGLPISFLLIAPSNIFYIGSDMGAAGLAWKMLLINIFTVNVTNYYIAKKFFWKFRFMFQIYLFSFPIAAAFSAKFLIQSFQLPGDASLIFSILIYFVFIIIFCLTFPKLLFGCSRLELVEILRSHGQQIFRLK